MGAIFNRTKDQDADAAYEARPGQTWLRLYRSPISNKELTLMHILITAEDYGYWSTYELTTGKRSHTAFGSGDFVSWTRLA